jgi:hypothetical protein
MKTFLTILVCVLFCTIFLVPGENAPMSTYFNWFLWSMGVIFVGGCAIRAIGEWDEEEDTKK